MTNDEQKLEDLLLHWAATGLIEHPVITTHAQLLPENTCEVTIELKLKSALTIKKMSKFREEMKAQFPWVKIKKIYNKHTIVLYYEAENKV